MLEHVERHDAGGQIWGMAVEMAVEEEVGREEVDDLERVAVTLAMERGVVELDGRAEESGSVIWATGMLVVGRRRVVNRANMVSLIIALTCGRHANGPHDET